MNIPFQILSIFSEEEEEKNFSYQIITKFLQLQHFDKKAGNFTKINIQYSIPKLSYFQCKNLNQISSIIRKKITDFTEPNTYSNSQKLPISTTFLDIQQKVDIFRVDDKELDTNRAILLTSTWMESVSVGKGIGSVITSAVLPRTRYKIASFNVQARSNPVTSPCQRNPVSCYLRPRDNWPRRKKSVRYSQ